ncbi:hypothetical protein RLO149_c000960 [Roseobacter litoralis Och 149]|uniref:Uncharacterized protein n=1 Tax=Roseobacter litoralis (strain ATCC 49566 / DSM 6996 / JCM 21268 / NBRC 15278 / OCh 149) TaxID=391595 RepID=F7ZE09_ROSLO|nr:hypothetical protein RLO149_c000960 [Roseobacter litoralis Och 149]
MKPRNAGIGLQPTSHLPKAKAAQRYRLQLRSRGTGRKVARQRHEARSRCTLPSPNAQKRRQYPSLPEGALRKITIVSGRGNIFWVCPFV